MQKTECDNCAVQQATTDSKLPKGWFLITRHDPDCRKSGYVALKDQAELCSWMCVCAFAAKQCEGPQLMELRRKQDETIERFLSKRGAARHRSDSADTGEDSGPEGSPETDG